MPNLSKIERLGLLGLLTSLVAAHLNLTFRGDNTDLIGSSVLYWLAIAALLHRKRFDLKFGSNFHSCVLGTVLITLVLMKYWFMHENDIFLRLSPALSLIGVSLIASGIQGIKQYWQEIGLLFLFAIPPGLIFLLVNLSPLTAQFSGFTLWALGFEVSVQGALIHLPTGTTEVYSGCSGVALMLQLLGIALMNLFLVTPTAQQKISLPAIALLIAFMMNGFRVALLAVLAAMGNQAAFKYWHVGNGSLVFSAIAVVAFSLVCQQFLPQEVNHEATT